MENRPCIDHGQKLVRLETQINGVDGKGGLTELKDRVDSLHTKFTFGIGFLTALQLLLPFIYSNVAKAISYLTMK